MIKTGLCYICQASGILYDAKKDNKPIGICYSCREKVRKSHVIIKR